MRKRSASMSDERLLRGVAQQLHKSRTTRVPLCVFCIVACDLGRLFFAYFFEAAVKKVSRQVAKSHVRKANMYEVS